MRRRLFRYLLPCIIAALFVGAFYRHVTRVREETANLAYYVEAERLDPIFAIEGTDPAKLQSALASLFTERDQIAKLYTKGESQTISASLYPDEFLKLLPGLEAARQEMLAHPSVASAKKYHALVLEATSQYASDARTLSESFNSVSTKIPQLGYLGGKASTTKMAATMLAVANAGLMQKSKEESRFACLEHMDAKCPSLATLGNELPQKLAQSTPIPSPGPSTLKADTLSRQILSIIPNFSSISDTLYGITSHCFGTAYAYERPYYVDQVPGQLGRKEDNVNDVYFYDIKKEAATEPSIPLYKQMLAAGVPLHYQSIGNLYMCPDSGIDVFSMGSMLGVLDVVKAHNPQIPSEKKLLTLPFVQKNDIAAYVEQQTASGTPEGLALAGRYLQGSADFDQVVMGAYNDNHFLVTWDKQQSPVEYEYMLLNRNYASLLFLMGNPTFIPGGMSLLSDTTPNDPSKMELREYVGDVSKELTDAQIMQMVRDGIQIDLGNFDVKSR